MATSKLDPMPDVLQIRLASVLVKLNTRDVYKFKELRDRHRGLPTIIRDQVPLELLAMKPVGGGDALKIVPLETACVLSTCAQIRGMRLILPDCEAEAAQTGRENASAARLVHVIRSFDESAPAATREKACGALLLLYAYELDSMHRQWKQINDVSNLSRLVQLVWAQLEPVHADTVEAEDDFSHLAAQAAKLQLSQNVGVNKAPSNEPSPFRQELQRVGISFTDAKNAALSFPPQASIPSAKQSLPHSQPPPPPPIATTASAPSVPVTDSADGLYRDLLASKSVPPLLRVSESEFDASAFLNRVMPRKTPAAATDTNFSQQPPSQPFQPTSHPTLSTASTQASVQAYVPSDVEAIRKMMEELLRTLQTRSFQISLAPARAAATSAMSNSAATSGRSGTPAYTTAASRQQDLIAARAQVVVDVRRMLDPTGEFADVPTFQDVRDLEVPPFAAEAIPADMGDYSAFTLAVVLWPNMRPNSRALVQFNQQLTQDIQTIRQAAASDKAVVSARIAQRRIDDSFRFVALVVLQVNKWYQCLMRSLLAYIRSQPPFSALEPRDEDAQLRVIFTKELDEIDDSPAAPDVLVQRLRAFLQRVRYSCFRDSPVPSSYDTHQVQWNVESMRIVTQLNLLRQFRALREIANLPPVSGRPVPSPEPDTSVQHPLQRNSVKLFALFMAVWSTPFLKVMHRPPYAVTASMYPSSIWNFLPASMNSMALGSKMRQPLPTKLLICAVMSLPSRWTRASRLVRALTEFPQWWIEEQQPPEGITPLLVDALDTLWMHVLTCVEVSALLAVLHKGRTLRDGRALMHLADPLNERSSVQRKHVRGSDLCAKIAKHMRLIIYRTPSPPFGDVMRLYVHNGINGFNRNVFSNPWVLLRDPGNHEREALTLLAETEQAHKARWVRFRVDASQRLHHAQLQFDQAYPPHMDMFAHDTQREFAARAVAGTLGDVYPPYADIPALESASTIAENAAAASAAASAAGPSSRSFIDLSDD